MLGAIAGDVIGSVHEFQPPLAEDFELFTPARFPTDDSVLTVAIAEAILDGHPYADTMRRWARRYPRAGYGMRFLGWISTPGAGPYQSYGNGSAMRVERMRAEARFDETCPGTVPQAASIALLSTSVEDAIRKAIGR